jgi:hypothetical protein
MVVTPLEKALTAEEERLTEQRLQLETSIRQMQADLEAIDVRLSHVRALLRTERAGGDAVCDESASAHSPPADVPDRAGVPREELDPVEIAFEALRERRGEPLHYRELAGLVISRGAILPGNDKAGTLVSRLVRDERFVRPLRRGYYALRLDYPKARNIGSRRPKKGSGRQARPLTESAERNGNKPD